MKKNAVYVTTVRNISLRMRCNNLINETQRMIIEKLMSTYNKDYEEAILLFARCLINADVQGTIMKVSNEITTAPKKGAV